MEFWFERNLGVGEHRDTSLIVELPSDDWTWCANSIERRRLPRGFSRRMSDVIGHFSRKHQFKPSISNRICCFEFKRRAQLKIEDLIAELAVFPLNNKIHVKVDGEIRYIREVKIKESSQDVVVVEVV